MKKFYYSYLAGLLILAMFSACEKDNNNDVPGKYENGALVLNEGSMGNSNASVSFLDAEKDSISLEIFNTENERPLGDVLQSAYIAEESAYLILNGSNKIEVVNSKDFTEKGLVIGLASPRYMTIANKTGYVTEWGTGMGNQVKIFDINNLSITDSVEVGMGPEDIKQFNSMVWVANSGGWGVDSTLSVIDPADNSVKKTIQVAHSPREMVQDANGDVWVLCYGKIEYDANYAIVAESPSKLVQISSTDYTVKKEILISQTMHPGHLDIGKDGKNLYYGGGYGFSGIYKVNINDTKVPENALIADKYFYGFNIDPENGDIYGLEAPSFTEAGSLTVYSAEGEAKATYTVGIGPNGVVFN